MSFIRFAQPFALSALLLIGSRVPDALAQNRTTAANDVDTARLAMIRPRLQTLIDTGKAAGVTYLVAQHGRVLVTDSVGFADVEAHKPMQKDSIYQIMSMTKNVTGVAAMMLVEDGRLDLRLPIEDYLPEFIDVVVEEKLPDGTTVTHKPRTPPAVWQLMDHTSGLASDPEGGLKDLPQRLNIGLEQAVKGYAAMHLRYEPGTRWVYSNLGIATLGRIIEVVSGQSYVDFVNTHLLQPLGMKDTFFFPPPDKADRIAMVYRHVDGKLTRSGADILAGDPALHRAGALYPAPEFGLFSTAGDLFNFYQMLANGGTYEGHRYLSARSIQIMREIFTPDVQPSGWLGGTGYGLTFEVVRDPLGTLLLQAPGTYGHGGAFGTQGWIDPASDLIVVALVQLSDGSGSAVRSVVIPMAEAAASANTK